MMREFVQSGIEGTGMYRRCMAGTKPARTQFNIIYIMRSEELLRQTSIPWLFAVPPYWLTFVISTASLTAQLDGPLTCLYLSTYGHRQHDNQLCCALPKDSPGGISAPGAQRAGRASRWRDRASVIGAPQHDVFPPFGPCAGWVGRFQKAEPLNYLSCESLAYERNHRVSDT